MDEDLAYMLPNSSIIISYSITIHLIKAKIYKRVNGVYKMLTVRVFPWKQEEMGEILFATVDLLCVRLKKKQMVVRVFLIHEADQYIDVGLCDKFFPARYGFNPQTDGSGVFALTDQYTSCVNVYSLFAQKGHNLLASIRL